MAIPRQTDRAFGISFAILFAVIFALAWLIFDAVMAWAAVASGLFLACALLCPGLLLPLNRLWRRLAATLATVNNYVLLGAFFYAIVTPMAIGLRLLRWDAMGRRKRTASYWSDVGRRTDRTTLPDMF